MSFDTDHYVLPGRSERVPVRSNCSLRVVEWSVEPVRMREPLRSLCSISYASDSVFPESEHWKRLTHLLCLSPFSMASSLFPESLKIDPWKKSDKLTLRSLSQPGVVQCGVWTHRSRMLSSLYAQKANHSTTRIYQLGAVMYLSHSRDLAREVWAT